MHSTARHASATQRSARSSLAGSSTTPDSPGVHSRGERSAKAAGADVAAPHPRDERVPTAWWVGGFAFSTVLCSVITMSIFDMPWYEPLVAVALAALVAVLAIRALGQTDLNPVSGVGKLS